VRQIRAFDLGFPSRSRRAKTLRRLTRPGWKLSVIQRWRALQHVTASASRVGDLANAALVLTHVEHRYLRGLPRLSEAAHKHRAELGRSGK